jgi:transcriptional regulator with XRE-family HTH domain
MAKFKKSDFKPARDWIDQIPQERREAVEAGAASIIAEARLSDIRKVLGTTQVVLAEKTGLKQTEISRIENNLLTVQIRTLNRYAVGLGATCRIVMDFPDGTQAEVPLRSGKPLKSQVKVSVRRQREADNFAEERLGA